MPWDVRRSHKFERELGDIIDADKWGPPPGGPHSRGTEGNIPAVPLKPRPPSGGGGERAKMMCNSDAAIDNLRTTAQQRQLHSLNISICDGIATSFLAWRDLPVHQVHVTSEVSEDALAVSAHRAPDALQLGDLRNITKSVLRKLFKDYNPDFVFISGGTPCKQLSRLAGNQEGFDGPDSALFWEFRRIVADATQECYALKLCCFFLFENVKMAEEYLQQAEAALGHAAVHINAAMLGHHKRPRIWICNWPVAGAFEKWMQPSADGRKELWVPFSARRMPDFGTIFKTPFYPRHIRGSATATYPEGTLPCLTCPL